MGISATYSPTGEILYIELSVGDAETLQKLAPVLETLECVLESDRRNSGSEPDKLLKGLSKTLEPWKAWVRENLIRDVEVNDVGE